MYISIIVPYFQGEKYLSGLLKNINEAVIKLHNECKVELIIVNDSPWHEIDYINDYSFEVRIIINENNSGIHQSRVNGLNVAKGKYILFLDQDDEIEKNTLVSQLKKIDDADVIVGNGLFKLNDKGSYKIYKNLNIEKQITKEWPFLFIKNLIISPGQVLIKKESIPDKWKKNVIQYNGADDYLLWLLMLNEGRKFKINSDFIYIHHDSGDNISFNIEKMNRSLEDLIQALSSSDYPTEKLLLLKRAIKYKQSLMLSKKDKIVSSFKNLDLFFLSVYFRLVYGGTVVSSKVLIEKNR